MKKEYVPPKSYLYSIKFDEDNLSFSEPVVEVVRKRSDKCDTLEVDLKELKD